MNSHQVFSRAIIGVVCALGIAACGGGGYGGGGMGYGYPTPPSNPAQSGTYSPSSLVSNGVAMSNHIDMNVANPWGIAFAPGLPAWIANNGSDTSAAYDGMGAQVVPTVQIPVGSSGDSSPTGLVANTSTDFVISTAAGPAKFIFSGEGGTISAWAQATANNAVTMYDDGAGGAVYKGLAIASNGTANFLYATDFHNNKVDVFDANFAKVSVTGHFTDATVPAGFAPFGIQAIGNRIYVTYAKQFAPDNRDDVAGPGLGYVDVFDTSGTLITRLVSAGSLNAPWGIALAPSNFGTLSGALLIANFGDGVINAYNPNTGASMGTMMDAAGMTLVIPGLWGIAFGNGAMSQPTNTLYFTAGPNDEQDGIYGSIVMAMGEMPMPTPMPGMPGMPGGY
jgi:uncharacterized protein (TIGR03118 family)